MRICRCWISAISTITEDGPVYRGVDCVSLAETASLEHTATLLWDATSIDPFASDNMPVMSEAMRAVAHATRDAAPIERAIAMLALAASADPRVAPDDCPIADRDRVADRRTAFDTGLSADAHAVADPRTDTDHRRNRPPRGRCRRGPGAAGSRARRSWRGVTHRHPTLDHGAWPDDRVVADQRRRCDVGVG